MSDQVFRTMLPPCEKCGRDSPTSRYDTGPSAPMGQWTTQEVVCMCGHRFTEYRTQMSFLKPILTRHGIIENVDLEEPDHRNMLHGLERP